MKDLFGLLAFAGLIAAQFLAAVVACSERFENDPRGRRGEPQPSGTAEQYPAAPMVSSAASSVDASVPMMISCGRECCRDDSALHKLVVYVDAVAAAKPRDKNA